MVQGIRPPSSVYANNNRAIPGRVHGRVVHGGGIGNQSRGPGTATGNSVHTARPIPGRVNDRVVYGGGLGNQSQVPGADIVRSVHAAQVKFHREPTTILQTQGVIKKSSYLLLK